MCLPPAVSLAATAVSSLAGLAAGAKAGKAQKQAMREAERRATLAREQQRRALNAERANQPDIAGMLKRAKEQTQGGLMGTFLTGPKGVNPNALKGLLGSSSLLGGGS